MSDISSLLWLKGRGIQSDWKEGKTWNYKETSKKISKLGRHPVNSALSSAHSLLCILICTVKIIDHFYIPETDYMINEWLQLVYILEYLCGKKQTIACRKIQDYALAHNTSRTEMYRKNVIVWMPEN